MTHSSLSSLAASLRARRVFALASVALAAFGSADLATAQLQDVFQAPPGGRTQVASWGQRLAVAPDGSLWAAVWYDDGLGQGDSSRHLTVVGSRDGGMTWGAPIDTPTIGDGTGVLATGTGCRELHVLWHATNGGSYLSTYHQVLDTSTGSWVGTPDVVLSGTSSSNQFSAGGVAVTPKGSVVAVVQTNSAPPPPWSGSWNAGLMIQKAGQTQWTGPFQINVGSSGTLADLQMIGEVAHIAYRSAVGAYGIFYRRFDVDQLAWIDPGDVPIGPNGNNNLYASNSNSIAADDLGNLYILYATGQGSAGSGQVWLAYARAGNTTSWTVQSLYSDPPLIWGNNTYSFYSLSKLGNLVSVYYSKRSESHTTLYRQAFVAGIPVVPETPVVTTTQPGRFTDVTGFRDSRAIGLDAIVAGTTASAPNGVVSVVLSQPAPTAVQWGSTCQGSLPSLPQLATGSVPQIGVPFAWGVSGLPAGAPGGLLVDVTCLPSPLSLSSFGLTGCHLYVAGALSLPYVADPMGQSTFSLAIPNNPTWAGITMQLQAFAVAPAANPAGIVTTNALAATLR